MSEMAETIALEATRYLAAVDVFRDLCSRAVPSAQSWQPPRVIRGPVWRSETEEVGELPSQLDIPEPGEPEVRWPTAT